MTSKFTQIIKYMVIFYIQTQYLETVLLGVHSYF